MQLVIDVSNNDTIDQKTFRASGAVALIAKATEGTGFRDKTLEEHRSVAREADKPFGSYVFLHPDSKGNEAAYYLDYAKPRMGDLQPIIDAEVTNLGVPELAKRAQSCARALEGKGYRPILYASAGIWTGLVAAEPSLKRLRVWEAQFPGRFSRWFPRLAVMRIKLRHGVSVVMWQWTDSYQVAGRHYDASALFNQHQQHQDRRLSMNGAHVTGGAIGAAVGAVLAPLLARYGVHVTDSTASLIGVAAASLGVGLGHVISQQGIWPAVKRAFVGPKGPSRNTPEVSPAAVTAAPVAHRGIPPPKHPWKAATLGNLGKQGNQERQTALGDNQRKCR